MMKEWLKESVRGEPCLIYSVLLLFCLHIYPQPTSSESLVVAESNLVLGGNTSTTQFNAGASRIPVAWSGSGFALSYYDHAPIEGNQGQYLLLMNGDADLLSPPIRVAEETSWLSKVLWDGSTYLSLIGREGMLHMKRFLPNGVLVAERTLTMPGDRGSEFEVSLDGEVLRVIRCDGGRAVVMDYSIDGERLSDPNRLSLQGELERPILLTNDLAVLSRSISMYRPEGFTASVSLEIFDGFRNQIAAPLVISVETTQLGSLCWNGRDFVCLGERRTQGGRVSVEAFHFDRQGRQIGNGVEIGSVPSGVEADLTSEVIWTGDTYVVIWDQGVEKWREDVYVRVLDENCLPITPPLRINPVPLHQVAHGTVLTDNGLVVFTVESGKTNPSIVYTRVVGEGVLLPKN
ncbi:MAG: hypothetical protein ABIH23_20580 [bacterium]